MVVPTRGVRTALLALALFLANHPGALATPSGQMPGAAAVAVDDTRDPPAPPSTVTITAKAAVRFYQLVLSRPYNTAFNRSGCPFSPSCSEYALQSLRTFGVVRSVVMTGDRLLRCHSGTYFGGYNLVETGTGERLEDLPRWLGAEGATRGGVDADSSPDPPAPQDPRSLAGFARSPSDAGSPSEYEFGLRLFETQDYDRAITAFKRQAFFASDSAAAARARYMIPLCEYAAGRFGNAVAGFTALASTSSPGRLKEASAFYEARSWDELGQHDAAQSVLRGVEFSDPDLRERVAFAIAWSDVRVGNWSAARITMLRFVDAYPEASGSPLARRIAQDLSASPPFGQKRVALGTLFSIVPGGGQLYAGRRLDALHSLLVVSGCTAIALRGERENSSTAYTLGGILAAAFYVANLYGGANSVAVYNGHQKESALRSYRTELHSSSFDQYVLP